MLLDRDVRKVIVQVLAMDVMEGKLAAEESSEAPPRPHIRCPTLPDPSTTCPYLIKFTIDTKWMCDQSLRSLPQSLQTGRHRTHNRSAVFVLHYA
jgi:hypothetical protein